MDDRIKRIAEHYGYEAQSRQLIEEMAELTQAINKLWRNADEDTKKRNELWINIAEELADTEIMLQQVKTLLDCVFIVTLIKNDKLDRQMKRIEGEADGKQQG